MNFINIMTYSVIAGIATLLGTALILRSEEWSRKNSIFIISFAAGVMLTISFLSLIPEASKMTPNVWIYIFAGFLAFYILQQLVMFHACHDDQCHVHQLGPLSAIGLTMHSLLDGVAIAAGFQTGWQVGLLTTIAVLLHEVPEGITITGILLHSNTPRPKIILFSVIVAMATPLGAMGAYFLLQNIAPGFLGILLAFTAGSFIYLAAADLLPETHRVHQRANALYFFSGVILITAVESFLH